MEYDPASPLIREPAAFERYFQFERYSMAMKGYAYTPEKQTLRGRALLLMVQLLNEESDVFVPYLALSYFDRFSSIEPIQEEDELLVVLCCIFLASKITQIYFSVFHFLARRPNLRNLRLELILIMEDRILNALEWKMRPVNALYFIGYFTQILPEDMRPSSFLVKDNIIYAEGDINFTKFRPSSIAAAAVFAAVTVQFPDREQDCKDCFASCDHVRAEEVNSCIEIMLDVGIRIGKLGACQGRAAASSSSELTKEELEIEWLKLITAVARRPRNALPTEEEISETTVHAPPPPSISVSLAQVVPEPPTQVAPAPPAQVVIVPAQVVPALPAQVGTVPAQVVPALPAQAGSAPPAQVGPAPPAQAGPAPLAQVVPAQPAQAGPRRGSILPKCCNLQ